MSDENLEDDTGLTGCAYTETEGMWPSFRNCTKPGLWPLWRREQLANLGREPERSAEQSQPLPDPDAVNE